MSKTLALLVALTLAACSVETVESDTKAPADTEVAPVAAVSSELLAHDPLACYGKCIDSGGSHGVCDVRCGCNSQCADGVQIEMNNQ